MEINNESNLTDLTQKIGEALKSRHWMLATAESCTGGLIGHLVTEIAGSSAYFAGGAIVYSYEAKERVLDVKHETLMDVGAVSSEVAQQMAQGALKLYNANLAVSVTGVAGPGGGSPDKPVGTVYIHLSGKDGFERDQRFVWQSDRSGNKLLSAQAALEMVWEYLEMQ